MSAPDNIGGDKSAKITHVKTTTIDCIKVAPVSVQGGGSAGQQSQQQTTAAFRAISSGGQSTQMRVVMPQGTIMPQSVLKQIEGAGRTQITAIPARTVSNTSITVTRPVTQTTYIPRSGVTSTSMQGQRLVTPIRAQGTPVTGLSGSFVRGTTVTRNTSPATTVISPAPTTWMANNGGQVQLIRAINHQPRQRIITQNISAAGVTGGGGTSGVVSVSSQSANQQPGNQTTLQTVSGQQAQQTFVATLATVLPRQQTATLVYTNVSNSQSQQYNPTVNTTQRFAVAPLANTQRQIRPIPMNKSFSTAKLGVGMNTTSISIRAPNPLLLNTTLNSSNVSGGGGSGNVGGVGASVAAGGGTMQSRANAGNSNISTTRIIQLQQQPGGATQQIIGSTGRIANNLMLQPIILNNSGGGKIGIRPPATMATKVQPSLTITQLGINKLPSNAQQQATSSASIQSVSSAVVSNANAVTSSAVGMATNLSQQGQSQQQTVTVNSQSPITQIVNVSQNLGGGAAGQLLTTQNVSSSGATVVPLAITSRGGSNVLTGTITPIKNAGLTVGKIISQQSSVNQHQSQAGVQSGQVNEMITSAQQHHTQQQPTSVFIHHARPHSGGNASGVGGGNSGSTATVIPSTGTSFLPPGSTFYYESVPASSVTVSTGVLSLTTTTVTSSTMSNNQIVTSSNMAPGIVTSLPFNTPSSATFTVVPSSNRSIGQIQIPVSSTPAQIQAVPVRFSAQLPSDQTITTSAIQQGQAHQQSHHQIIIPSQAAAAVAAQQSQSQQSQGHMVIPLPTSLKVTSGNNTVSAISTAAFLRKRDTDGSPIRAAKNLGPTLLSMGAPSSNASVTPQQLPPASAATPDNKKEPRTVSPASSDGSTTVSANSSPGVDQQINEELTPVNRMPNDSHFNPINDMYPNHQNASASTSRDHGGAQSNNTHLNGAIDCPPRKKSRRSTNDSQQSAHSHASSHPSLNPPASNSSQASNVNGTTNSNSATGPGASGSGVAASSEPPKVNNNNQSVNINSNKENTKPTEFVLRKPRTCTLLNSYKQNWKAANNHFQRHSDVKPREERRPTVMDLANQANVLGKINGWKVHHLKSQMEDLCESEGKGYDKLTVMLKQMESHGKNPDIERISDLIKGNIQRSKIIVDGITEAQNQIMKIFDHKSHISDIIHRCASKRNFKKREKT